MGAIVNMVIEYWWILLCVILAVAAIAVIVVILAKKPKRIKVDDEFISNLVGLLGEVGNISKVDVDNGRLKITVKDLDIVNLEGIKEIASAGVFVTGNIIKVLFKLDSQIIKKAIERKL